MKEIWCAKVAIFQNVEFQHAAPLGVNQVYLTPKCPKSIFEVRAGNYS